MNVPLLTLDDACPCTGNAWELYFRAWQERDRATGGEGDALDGPGPSVALVYPGRASMPEDGATP